MANHYEAARSAIDEYQVKRADLIDEYALPRPRPEVIASLHQDMRDLGLMARVHAKLAIVQELQDVKALRS